jgi:hypothetical protein
MVFATHDGLQDAGFSFELDGRYTILASSSCLKMGQMIEFEFFLTYRVKLEPDAVTNLPGASNVILFWAFVAANDGAAYLFAYCAGLTEHQNDIEVVGSQSSRTCDHLCWGMEAIPSTSRNRASSVNEVSGMKTAQTTCAHP